MQLQNVIDLLAARQKFSLLTGVYFLFNEEELVYIGQSIDVMNRLSTHANAHVHTFDSFSIHECRADERLALEKKYIKLHRPPGNVSVPGRDDQLMGRRNTKKYGHLITGPQS